MKSHFQEYYDYDDARTDEIWKNGMIVLDTNILLGLYRLEKRGQEEVLDTIETLGDRLFIPNHVASEFHRNRLKIIPELEHTYDKLKNKLKDYLNVFQNEAEKKITKIAGATKHPLIDGEDICCRIKGTIEDCISEITEMKAKHPDFFDNDPLLEKITELLDGKVGDGFDESKFDEIIKDAKDRIERRTPPGYCDDSKRPNEKGGNKYGDIFIWLQIIEKAKQKKLPVILATSEKKEDWWNIDDFDKSVLLCPRPELRREMRKEANVDFLLYTTEDFIVQTRERLGAQISDETIDRVKYVAAYPYDSQNSSTYNPADPLGTMTVLNQFAKTLDTNYGMGTSQAVVKDLMDSLEFGTKLTDDMRMTNIYNSLGLSPISQLTSWFRNLQPLTYDNWAIYQSRNDHQPWTSPSTDNSLDEIDQDSGEEDEIDIEDGSSGEQDNEE